MKLHLHPECHKLSLPHTKVVVVVVVVVVVNKTTGRLPTHPNKQPKQFFG